MRHTHGTPWTPRPRGRHWLRWLVLAALVLWVLLMLYGCAMQQLVYSSRGTLIFLPAGPLSR